MGRKSIAEERRSEILDNYVQVIYQEGFENTSIAKIARHMDVPPSLIMHYFKTKEEMVYALIEDFFFDATVAGIEEIKKIPDPIERIRIWVFDSILNPEHTKGDFYEMTLIFQYLGCRNEKIASQINKAWKYLVDSLADDIQDAMDEGTVTKGDATIMAQSIWVTMSNVEFFHRFYDSTNREKLFASLRTMIAGILGIKPFKPRSGKGENHFMTHQRWSRETVK